LPSESFRREGLCGVLEPANTTNVLKVPPVDISERLKPVCKIISYLVDCEDLTRAEAK
jgi:hypothetical protein